MNKKSKIVITVTLIITILIQIFIPSFLLIHHYTLITNTLATETEYRFQLDRIYIDYNNSGVVTASSVTGLTFEIYDVYSLHNEKFTAAVNENGIAVVKEIEGIPRNDSWFNYKYYANSTFHPPENLTVEKDVNVMKTITDIHRQYNWFNRNDPDREYAYVTAKIYKGMFIPTAIYFRDQKIITINAY